MERLVVPTALECVTSLSWGFREQIGLFFSKYQILAREGCVMPPTNNR
jgi:hypothetical protein